MKKSFLLFSVLTLLSTSALAEKLAFTLEGKTYEATLFENDAAAFLLKRLPFYTAFENLGGTERVSYLKYALPIGKTAKSFKGAKKGDLAYFLYRKNLVVFLEDPKNTDGYVPLGRLPQETFKMIKNSESKVMQVVKVP